MATTRIGLVTDAMTSHMPFERIALACPQDFVLTAFPRSAVPNDFVEKSDGAITMCDSIDELLAADPRFVIFDTDGLSSLHFDRELPDYPELAAELYSSDARPPSYALLYRFLLKQRVPLLLNGNHLVPYELIDPSCKAVGENARVQVADANIYRPLVEAQCSLAGEIEPIERVDITTERGATGIALMRRLLGAGYTDVTISARVFPKEFDSRRLHAGTWLADFDFANGQLGTYDSPLLQNNEWHYGFARIRGGRGEICGEHIYLSGRQRDTLIRQTDAEHRFCGYTRRSNLLGGGEEWTYRYSSRGVDRLTDKWISMATCLGKMLDYIQGGPEFYGLRDLLQNQYLQSLLEHSIRQHQPVSSTRQWWAGT